jgi:aryl-alcohol dehydrogenase-like predicted oxidoreductase
MKQSKNIGFGTAAIGRPTYINIKQDEKELPFSLPRFWRNGMQVLEDAYKMGIRHFDTAPGYGLAEQLLLEWLEKKNDPSITVSTKWGYSYVANFDPNAKRHEIKEHSLEKLNEQWQYSKKLLPYLKVYQIHSATFDTGVLENEAILKRLHQLKIENGLIIGLTTTGTNQVEVLKKALTIEVESEQLFQSFQCTFNVLDQSIMCLKEELSNIEGPFIIKEALANGRLIPNTNYFGYSDLYKFMLSLAEKYNVGADAIALRYCIDNFHEAKVLSGANNSIHLTANLKADGFTLTASEIEQLAAFGIYSEEYWQERKALSWN